MTLPPGSNDSLRLCVLVITRCRPQMLGQLLTSFGALNRPADCNVLFVVVDNDKNASAVPVFEEFAKRVGQERSRYLSEPRAGIPLARNRALDEAVALKADLAAFIDDDEIAHADWLVELVSKYRKHTLSLIGGPIRPVAWNDHDALTKWQRIILGGVQSRHCRKELRAKRKSNGGEDGDVVIVTNNWMIDVTWWRESGLRFDESLRASGGSDALFYSQAKARGIKSGWCPLAIVYESTPASRLSLSYQFKRARSQANSGFHRKYARRTAIVIAVTVVSCLFKTVGAIASFAVVPFGPGTAVVRGARALGWATGRLDALCGRSSQFYVVTDGG